MIPTDPTAEEVIALVAHLCEKYNARVERKSESEIMVLCGRVLEVCGIQEEATFMGSYCTSIPDITGKAGTAVYLAFELGVADDVWSLRSQHDVAVHEIAGHAEQVRKNGAVRFAGEYLCSQELRAIKYETPAYSISRIEMARLRGEPPPDLDALASHLNSYNCDKPTIAAAQVAMQSWERTAEAGGLSLQARDVEEWWRGRRG